MAKNQTRRAIVDLSQRHAGQMVEHTATMTCEGDLVGQDWRPIRWRATLDTLDRSTRERTTECSPWCATVGEAERWLESRGLHLGGAYWHGSRLVEDSAHQ
jgi:hypothetical protein